MKLIYTLLISMANWSYRICEESINGKSLFYPERRKLLGWTRIEIQENNNFVCFFTLSQAKSYINQQIIENADDIIVTKYHEA